MTRGVSTEGPGPEGMPSCAEEFRPQVYTSPWPVTAAEWATPMDRQAHRRASLSGWGSWTSRTPGPTPSWPCQLLPADRRRNKHGFGGSLGPSRRSRRPTMATRYLQPGVRTADPTVLIQFGAHERAVGADLAIDITLRATKGGSRSQMLLMDTSRQHAHALLGGWAAPGPRPVLFGGPGGWSDTGTARPGRTTLLPFATPPTLLEQTRKNGC